MAGLHGTIHCPNNIFLKKYGHLSNSGKFMHCWGIRTNKQYITWNSE